MYQFLFVTQRLDTATKRNNLKDPMMMRFKSFPSNVNLPKVNFKPVTKANKLDIDIKYWNKPRCHSVQPEHFCLLNFEIFLRFFRDFF